MPAVLAISNASLAVGCSSMQGLVQLAAASATVCLLQWALSCFLVSVRCGYHWLVWAHVPVEPQRLESTYRCVGTKVPY